MMIVRGHPPCPVICWQAVMYTLSISGRSSRSTLISDKAGIQERCDARILKRFMGHDMAPVAGGIPDGEEDGFMFFCCAAEGLISPRVPVHGIMGMLLQVRALLA